MGALAFIFWYLKFPGLLPYGNLTFDGVNLGEKRVTLGVKAL